MDKDMMGKVNEAMKANGMRELSLDEMDMVNGGNQEIIYSVHQCGTEEQLISYVYTFLASMEKSFGKDIVADYIKQDWPDYNSIQDYRNAGLDGLYNHLALKWIDGQGVD